MPNKRKIKAAPPRKQRKEHPRRPPAGDTPVEYNRAVDILARRDEAGMLDLAANVQTPPEILFLLSQAREPGVRSLVAQNPATPPAADDVLVNDQDAEIRLALVQKIARLLPEICPGEIDKFGQSAARILAKLALDCDVLVRRAIAEQISHLESVPKETVLALAGDVDALVAVPVIEFSPLLDDQDLIALANGDINPLCLSAMARRDQVSEAVSDCLVGIGDITVVATLLRNQTAHIRETTLDRIVASAHKIDSWHQPLTERPELDGRLALKLANFISNELIDQLANRNDLGDAVITQLKERVRNSVASQITKPPADTRPKNVPGKGKSAQLLEQAIDQRHEAAILSQLAVLADVGVMAVRRIFATRIPKAIVALAWKANLSAEVALRLQEFPGRILYARRLLPAEDGGYPMTEEELRWHLGALGFSEAQPGAASG